MDRNSSRSDLISETSSVYNEIDSTRMSSSLTYSVESRHVVYHSEGFFRRASSLFRRPHTSSPKLTRRRSSRFYRNLSRKCRKLDRVNRRLSCVFYILASAVSVLILLYIGFIGLIIMALPKLRGDFPYCVDESSIVKSGAREIWDDLTKEIDSWEYTVEQRCFADVSWMPKFFNMVNNSVHRHAEQIETKHDSTAKKLDESGTVSHSLDKFYRDDKIDSNSLWGLMSEQNRSFLVFAHLSLDTRARYSGKEVALKWIRASQSSSFESMDLNVGKGELIIKKEGCYFVYSSVAFKAVTGTSHKVIKNHRDYSISRRKILMEALWTPKRESFLQGVFKLGEDDTLSVVVPLHSVETEQSQSQWRTYFGAYLVQYKNCSTVFIQT